MKYKLIEGIAQADIAFKAYGGREKDLFENAALALFEIMADLSTVIPSKSLKLKAQSSELEDLLFEFLNGLVFLKDAKNMLFSKFGVSIVPPSEESLRTPLRRDFRLSAEIWGEEINPVKHKLRLDVKAVTRHKFFVKKESGRYIAQVVLDI